MNVMWVLFCVALTGVQLGYGLPLGTPHTYLQDEGGFGKSLTEGWHSENALYAAIPALVLVLAAVGFLFGCTWCYRHKDRKLFTASVSQLHDASRRAQPDSGFSEPVNNNITEDNNNGPISLREMQNIANNNATAYIVSENEERNRMSRESVVEFEPLPEIGVPDPLERYADWFGNEDFPRDRLQYLREIGRGWFGRIVQGEVESEQSSVAVKILNQNASPEDRARFLAEARMYRDLRHENVLAFIAKCLQEDPWILVFELCHADLAQYLEMNRPLMTSLVESGAPLRLACDVTAALAYLHDRGFCYGDLRAGTVLVRGEGVSARAVLGRYVGEDRRAAYSAESDVWSLGVLLWELWAWRTAVSQPPLPMPTAPALYRDHMYQLMQLCWTGSTGARPSAAQAHALVQHLMSSHERTGAGAGPSGDFEERWQRLKPNSIPVLDEHVAQVHAGSSSTISEDLNAQTKSESMTNLHGSLEDVRNIYLTHNEAATLDCNQANERTSPSDSAVDPWLKDLIAGSQDDISYYKDVSDVIKNLDNMLNSEKTSSSESSHQASPSRDNLSLDCKKEFPVQSGLVKSPGIRNFQNLESDFGEEEPCAEEETDRDTVGTLSHSFERHSDSASQHTLANLTPDSPNKEFDQISEAGPSDVEMPKDNVVSVAIEDVCLDVSEDVESEVTEDCQTCDIVGAKTNHPSLEPLVSKSVEEVTSERETDRSSAGVTEIPLEETKLDSQGNVVIDMEYLDETVSSETPLITRSEVLDSNVQIESQVPDNIRSLTMAFLVDQVNHASSQIENTLNDNIQGNLNDVSEESPEINHNERPEMTDVIRESELIVDSVISAATDALMPKKLEETCFKVAENDLNDVPIVVNTYQSKETSHDEESTLVETINEVTDMKESNDSNLQSVPNIHLSPSRFRDDDVTDVSDSIDDRSLDTASTLPLGNVPDVLQTTNQQLDSLDETENKTILPMNRVSNESTVYMDLINTTAMKINKSDSMSSTLKEVINTCIENAPANETECTLVREDSTMYMDLPSVMNDTHNFLHNERVLLRDVKPAFTDVTASTPKNAEEQQKKSDGQSGMPEGVTQTKLENVSPFDSPTRSNPTETYDENSSMVLGPSEYCSLELFKSTKLGPADIEIPKEELLAFSSNFSEMNLATPSPLRDVNFLNEVPDIEVNDAKESMTDTEEKKQLDCESESKERGPSTPPNSPGNFLATTSQFEPATEAGVSSSREEIDISQIELQMTSKLAMAENENNMNIEYSGPLTVEGRDDIPEAWLAGNGALQDARDALALDEDCMRALRNELELKLPLAQVASIEPTEDLEPSEPSEEASVQVFRAPEMIVSYPGALSPIAEETRGQLSAYDNDVPWNASTRTDSSSYLEPCNNSSDEVTELPTGTGRSGDTYTVRSRGNTYTVHEPDTKPVTEISADSLNCSPAHVACDTESPALHRTHDSDDKSPCEMISQISPTFLLSPSYDSVPEETENANVKTLSKQTVLTDTKSSKLSETQCLSKATSIDSWCSNDTLFNVEEDFEDSEVNVEFNKEDDNSESTNTLNDNEPSHCPTYIVHDDGDKSECDSFTPDSITANHTFTKQRADETPIVVLTSKVNDSSAVNTQTRDLAYGTLVSGLSSCTTELLSAHDELWRFQQPELVRRSPIVDDTMISTPPREESKNCIKEPSPKIKHEQMMKKMDSVEITCLQDISDENNSTEPLVAIEESRVGEDLALVANQLPLVGDELPKPTNETTQVDTELPKVVDELLQQNTQISPIVIEETSVVENDSELPPQEALVVTEKVTNEGQKVIVASNTSPDMHFRNIALSAQSTPLVEAEYDNTEIKAEALVLPENDNSTGSPFINVPNFQMFINSAELRPQDFSPMPGKDNASSQDTGLLLEGESKVSQNQAFDRTPNYASFEGSAVFKPQDVNSRSSQEISALSSNEDFRVFENSVRSRPQDLSAIEATSIMLQGEIKSSELAMGSSTNHTKQRADETPIVVLTSEVNDSSPVNTQTRDLAYGTLVSGLSSCTTELFSAHDELWRFQQPELVRRSPIVDDTMISTPPREESKNCIKEPSPKIKHEQMMKKVDSVEITCLQNISDESNSTEPLVAIEESRVGEDLALVANQLPLVGDELPKPTNETTQVDTELPKIVDELLQQNTEISPIVIEETSVGENDSELPPQKALVVTEKVTNEAQKVIVASNTSPDMHFRNMALSAQSTPLVEAEYDNTEIKAEALVLPENDNSTGSPFINVPNFQMFINSAELRPQDFSPMPGKDNASSQDTGLLLEGESKVSQNQAFDRTPNYASFEGSAVFKPQDVNSRSSQEISALSSNEDFRVFENSVRSRPQDLSAIEATSIMLQGEIKSSELAMGSSTNHTKQRADETPIVVLTSEVNDSSPVNTQTRDLAYGTLVSGLSSCTTELLSAHDELWRFQQPELVRRSPIVDDTMISTPPREESKNCIKEPSPKIKHEQMMKKMDSVEITCLQDISDENNSTEPLVAIEESRVGEDLALVANQLPLVGDELPKPTNETTQVDTELPKVVDELLQQNTQISPIVIKETSVVENDSELPPQEALVVTEKVTNEGQKVIVASNTSPDMHFGNMALSAQSTPLVEAEDDNTEIEAEALVLPENDNSTGSPFINVPNSQMFINSAELRPQDFSPMPGKDKASSQDTGLLLEGKSKVSQNQAFDRTPSYASFEGSAVFKPQDVNSRSSQEISTVSSNEDFRVFENSVRSRPQDLSAIEATSILLQGEIKSSELAMGSSTNVESEQTSQNFNGFSRNSYQSTPLVNTHNFNIESEYDQNEQPHSIIYTESPMTPAMYKTFDSNQSAGEDTFDSHTHRKQQHNSEIEEQNETSESPQQDGDQNSNENNMNGDDSPHDEVQSPKEDAKSPQPDNNTPNKDNSSPKENILCEGDENPKHSPSPKKDVQLPIDNFSSTERADSSKESKVNISENLEGVSRSDLHLPNGSNSYAENDNQCNGEYFATVNFINENFEELLESNVDSHLEVPSHKEGPVNEDLSTPVTHNGHAGPTVNGFKEGKTATENFLSNEKIFCQSEIGIPLLGDIRFTGPASEIMSTSFNEPSPTEPNHPLPTTAAEILKEWDSDSDDSRDTNSSSGEFIWKDGDGHETPVVPSYFDHQRATGQQPPPGSGNGSDGSGSSGSGSEGDEVEFVPSSWDCRATPAKSSLRSLEQAQPISGSEGKKHVVFKRQKYHCVYEYPRETPDEREVDYCTYADWDAAASEEAELGYHRLYGAMPFDGLIRAPLAAGGGYDDDFYISSSARPFESLGMMSSQFFPGLHALKSGRGFDDEPSLPDLVTAPAPPSGSPGSYPDYPTPSPLAPQILDLITPDSGVEDITPAVEYEKKLPSELGSWRAADSPSSSGSASPGSPSEALGGLRHTRDKLKLDLPASPLLPSPRAGKVFNFSLEKPRRAQVAPIVPEPAEELPPEPTFSTFGKPARPEPEPTAIILEVSEEAPVEPRVGSAVDSGDEDSGIESSTKASLERKPHVSQDEI